MTKTMGKTELIKQLQIHAKNVLQLKETHRQKRPIVIEFSGSPKSGKTSCITSLSLFLKRNGFRVEIVQERASVCPVADKRSPMFNLWTSCMSVSGMLAALEKEPPLCDVLILDRGIFDACCWFEWLNKKKMFEDEQKKLVEQFLLMDSLVNRIDIVFSFVAEASVSIKREYANLLTDKPGSIMNKPVLEEYLQAIEDTIKSKEKYFHKIARIDTSNKNQDQVGKEVTEITLETLKDTLMERIGFCEPNETEMEFLTSKNIFSFNEVQPIIRKVKFDLRDSVENAIGKLQPIPIAVLTDSKLNTVLMVKKTAKATSGESPEKDKSLLYIGGHSRIEDSTAINERDILSICRYTLRREIKEEIGLSLAVDNITPFAIYTPTSVKSKKHIAICFLLEVDSATLKLSLDQEELIMTKGKSKSGRFFSIDEILHAEYDNLEIWSKLILKECFKKDIIKDGDLIVQDSLFDLLDS